jgi:hypothetical protein
MSRESMVKNEQKADFGIEISFDAKKESPTNALKVLTELIETFELLDVDLVGTIDAKIKPIVLLEDIEIGSIRTWLKEKIESIDDEGIKDLDWRKIVGSYLVKAKYAIVKFLDKKTSITNRSEIQSLEAELFRLAKETDIKKLPEYSPIPTAKLIQHMSKITTTVKSLRTSDKAFFFTSTESVDFNVELDLSPESIIDILTSQKLSSQGEMILKVKKPDYLGESMWELRHGRKHIEAKISDMVWLKSFQQREKDVRPGDSLKADVITTVSYDQNNEVLGVYYEVTKIHEVIKPAGDAQISLIDLDDRDE